MTVCGYGLLSRKPEVDSCFQSRQSLKEIQSLVVVSPIHCPKNSEIEEKGRILEFVM